MIIHSDSRRDTSIDASLDRLPSIEHELEIHLFERHLLSELGKHHLLFEAESESFVLIDGVSGVERLWITGI